MLDKFEGALIGSAIGNSSSSIDEMCKSLIISDDFTKIDFNLTYCLPLGIFYKHNIYSVINSSKKYSEKEVESNQIASVALALMSHCAVWDVPVGLWASELGIVISGIDDNFLWLIDRAVSLSSEKFTIEKVLKLLGGTDSQSIVAFSFFCCALFPNNLKKALEMSLKHKKHKIVSTIVGFCIGCKLGFSNLELNEDYFELKQIANELFLKHKILLEEISVV